MDFQEKEYAVRTLILNVWNVLHPNNIDIILPGLLRIANKYDKDPAYFNDQKDNHSENEIKFSHITYYANKFLVENRYQTFTIPKKDGGERIIHAPHPRLKSILRAFVKILNILYYPQKEAMGFVPGRSIKDNAKLHQGANYIYNIDLKDFFHRFDRKKVKYALMKPPFSLHGEKEPIAFRLACLFTHPIQETKSKEQPLDVLPQGSPASPILTNIMCKRMDRRLSGLAKRFGLKYSRYADDITFSADYNIFNEEVFQHEHKRIINLEGHTINEKKVRLQGKGNRQEVTGLVVNEKVNISRKFVKNLRAYIYRMERYGLDEAQNIYLKYIDNQSRSNKGKPDIKNVVAGKLEFMRMVKGNTDSTFKKLYLRYAKVVGISIEENYFKEDESSRVTEENKWNENIPNVDDLIKKGEYKKKTTNTTRDRKNHKNVDHHHPKATAAFIIDMWFEDNFGFKELSHGPDFSGFDNSPDKLLDKLKSHPNFIYHFKGNRLTNFKPINSQLQQSVVEVIEVFEKDGIPYYNSTKKHPYNESNKNYYNRLFRFKKNTRFGSANEYTKFDDFLENVFSKLNKKDSIPFSRDNIEFKPEEQRSFSLMMGRIPTWIESFKRALIYIFQGIVDHSNIDGKTENIWTRKKVEISIKKIDEDKCLFSVKDKNSISDCSPNYILKKIFSSKAYQKDMRHLCDWDIHYDHDNGNSQNSYALKILNKNDKMDGLEKIKDRHKEIPYSGKGFIHYLTFYGIQ